MVCWLVPILMVFTRFVLNEEMVFVLLRDTHFLFPFLDPHTGHMELTALCDRYEGPTLLISLVVVGKWCCGALV